MPLMINVDAEKRERHGNDNNKSGTGARARKPLRYLRIIIFFTFILCDIFGNRGARPQQNKQQPRKEKKNIFLLIF